MRASAATLAALLLAHCGGDAPPLRVIESWQPSADGCTGHALELKVVGAPQSTVEAGGRKATATSASPATLRWKASELPAGDAILLTVSRGGSTDKIEHRLKRPPRSVGFPSTQGALPDAELRGIRTRLASGGIEDAGPPATGRLEGTALKFSLSACNLAAAQAEEGTVDVRDNAIEYRLPLTAALARPALVKVSYRDGRQESVQALSFRLKLRSVDAIHSELIMLVNPDELATGLFSGLPQRPAAGAPRHQPGTRILVFSGDPRRSTTSATLLGARHPSLDSLTAVAVPRERKVVIQGCRYFTEGKTVTVERVRRDTDVTVYELRSGRVLATRAFQGGAPVRCPEKLWLQRPGVVALEPAPRHDLSGSGPLPADIHAWLERL